MNTAQSHIQDLVLKFVNVLTVVIIIVLVQLRAPYTLPLKSDFGVESRRIII